MAIIRKRSERVEWAMRTRTKISKPSWSPKAVCGVSKAAWRGFAMALFWSVSGRASAFGMLFYLSDSLDVRHQIKIIYGELVQT